MAIAIFSCVRLTGVTYFSSRLHARSSVTGLGWCAAVKKEMVRPIRDDTASCCRDVIQAEEELQSLTLTVILFILLVVVTFVQVLTTPRT